MFCSAHYYLMQYKNINRASHIWVQQQFVSVCVNESLSRLSLANESQAVTLTCVGYVMQVKCSHTWLMYRYRCPCFSDLIATIMYLLESLVGMFCLCLLLSFLMWLHLDSEPGLLFRSYITFVSDPLLLCFLQCCLCHWRGERVRLCFCLPPQARGVFVGRDPLLLHCAPRTKMFASVKRSEGVKVWVIRHRGE